MSKYWYDLAYSDTYQFEDYEDCAQHIADAEMGDDDDFLIMVEVIESSKSGQRYCNKNNQFTDNMKCIDYCYDYSNDYTPRNGKWGICKHLSWGCIETGREWKVYPDGSYKKISGRK